MSIDQLNSLAEKLKNEKWPKIYMFKFIIPNNNQLLAQTEAIFGDEANSSIRKSRNGKYLSITSKEMMLSAEEVIKRYEKAYQIEGLIAL